MDCDVLVSGGGIAGLVATAAFAEAGFDVLCVDPAPAITTRDAEGSDLRSTAFLQPARDLLDEIGLWAQLQEHATPLHVMRIVDAGGERAEPRVIKDFDAAEISDAPFGWNLPNWLLRREMVAHLNTLERVTYRTGVGTTTLFTREAEARVGLSDGTRIRTRLVVAADGRDSAMRQAAGIETRRLSFGQKALAFAVTHPIPHGNVSTEIHRTGGPFTLVPLPDYEGRPSSAVVWMEDAAKADALFAMDVAAFEAEMAERSCLLLGPLKLASNRSLWPIISQDARAFTAQRLALVAEAAHVVPPIGAQGLNMSLRDIATLRDLARRMPDALGSTDMLRAYDRARGLDVGARVAGVSLLNKVSQMSNPLLRDVRAAGIETLYALKPIRQGLMRLGLGTERKTS